MTQFREYRVGGGSSPFGFLGPLLILALFFTALFFLAKGVFWLLSWVAPILLIITLILDYTVVTDFFKFVGKLLRENTIMGILAVLLVIFGYPIVSGFLFFKAIGKRSIKKVVDQVEREKNTYTEYEEVVEEEENFLELPPLNKKPEPTRQTKSNEYDDMFK
ncbi:MAG: hypothetical protein IPL08_21820 [Saprospiraceae bacterium]|nr:hypothetical protein [Saprospiraceae bacterium]MBK8670297.1 hypothetical protein [Saprospiraceae bacterium]MBL0101728.1 hypothetical protein [Saprospiraceae bacterium]